MLIARRHVGLLLLFALGGCGSVTAAALEDGGDAAAALEHDAAAGEREGPADAAEEATQQATDGAGELKPLGACGAFDPGGMTFNACVGAKPPSTGIECATCETTHYRIAGCRIPPWLCVATCSDCPQ
jgi:hypothetical protein